MKGRFWEIDALRGLALCLMVLFHFLFDLSFFKAHSIDLSGGLWLFVGRSAGVLFLLLVGVSLALSNSKGRNALHFLKRGAFIFFLGLLITAFTLAFFPQEAIWFGVLHLIGLSIILSIPFLKFKRLNVALGALVTATGLFLMPLIAVQFPWLLPLGLVPQGFQSFDYFPILPWFGIVLLGIAFGNFLYPEGKRAFRSPELKIPLLGFLGRNSLLIYFLHQPIILGLLFLVF